MGLGPAHRQGKQAQTHQRRPRIDKLAPPEKSAEVYNTIDRVYEMARMVCHRFVSTVSRLLRWIRHRVILQKLRLEITCRV